MIAMSLHPTLSEVPLPIPCSFALVNFSAPGFRRNGTILRLRSIRHLLFVQPVATPVNWTQGDDVIIVPSVTDAQAREKFPGGWKAPKSYLRIVPQPHV